MPTFLVIVSLVWIAFYLYEVRKVKWTTSLVVQTAMFVALSFVLSMIKFYHYPQGGSLSLASMLPLMLCGILYAPGVGMTAGVASGLLSLMTDFYVIHPAQLMLDYFLPNMMFGLSGMFGTTGKIRPALGALVCSVLSVFCNVLSGVVFFAAYAGEMNVWRYSIIYNCSTNGIEALLSIAILLVLPLARLRKQLKKE